MAGQYPITITGGGAFGSTNRSSWYNAGGCQVVFPSLNVALDFFTYDENAQGMVGYVDQTYQPTYELISPTLVTLRFAIQAHGLNLTGPWYFGVWVKQYGQPTYYSTPYNAERAGSGAWRQVEIVITCLLDITTLGVPLGAFSEDTYATIIG